MSPLSQAMLVVFIAAWCCGVVAWLYATRCWFDRRAGRLRKALIGYGVFVAAVAMGFAAGGVAEMWGGGWR
jgi:hypothetical protein